MEEKENLKKIILLNYMSMIDRKDINSLREIKDVSSNLFYLLWAMGASGKMLSQPAHEEQLEQCLKRIIEATISAIKDKDEDEGYEVKLLKNGLSTHITKFRWEEKFRLEFEPDAYKFEIFRNFGEINQEHIQGNTEKGTILSYAKNDPWYKGLYAVGRVKESEEITQKKLDENGFVIIQKTGFVQGEVKNKKSIKREGKKCVVNGEAEITWDGNPSRLNEGNETVGEFFDNMIKTMSKYPETKAYYEDIVGKEIVQKAEKFLEEIQQL